MYVLITLAMARRLVAEVMNSWNTPNTIEAFEFGLLEADYSGPFVYLDMVDCKLGFNEEQNMFFIYDYEPNTPDRGVGAAFRNAGLAMPVQALTV